MTQTQIPTAAAQPLVSFSFNLPADVATIMQKACGAVGHTPAQYAANAVASLLCADTEYYRDSFTEDEWFNNVTEGPRLVELNSPAADVEHVNVTLLKEDLAFIIEEAEEALRGNLLGAGDLHGVELIAFAEGMTVEKVMAIQAKSAAFRAAEGFPTPSREEIEEDLETPRAQAAYLRRLLAARGTN